MLISKWQRLPFETSNVLNSPWRFNNDLLTIYHLWMNDRRFNNDLLSIYHLWMNDRRFNNDLLSIYHLWMNDRWSVLFPADVTRQFFFLFQEILTLPIMHTYIEFYGTWHEDALRQTLAFLWCFLIFSYTWPIFSWSFWKVNKILKNDASVASSACQN